MIRIRYVISVMGSSDSVDVLDELGNNARSVVSMGPRKGIDGVGQRKIDRWVMDECLENCRGRKCFPPLTCNMTSHFASKFKVPRFAVYRALCEHLDSVNRVADVIECFHKMASELGQELEGEQARWILRE
jgi:hypothetical protein